MIHVCFPMYDKDGRYSKFTGTTMLSIFENSNTPPPRSITVHILHDNTLTLDNLQKFVYIAGQYNQIVKFYNVEKDFADRINEVRNLMPDSLLQRYSIAIFYLFLVPHVIPTNISKIIVSGSDLIYNMDISEFYGIDLGDHPMAAVPEKPYYGVATENFALCRYGIVKPEDYINDGIFLMNVDKWREEQDILTDGMKFVFNDPQCNWFDQDIVNYSFVNRILKLPMRFNTFVREKKIHRDYTVERCIYHYLSETIGMDITNPFDKLWLEHFVKTPWFNEETISHLYEGARQIYITQKNFATRISAMVSGKIRAFFVSPPNVDAVKNIFYVNADEEIILADSSESLQKLTDSLNSAQGKKIFFILTPEFPAVYQNLSQAGFIFGKDFLNGMEFLSDANGVPLYSYPLVKLL